MKQPSEKRRYARPKIVAVLLMQRTPLLQPMSGYGEGSMPPGMEPEPFGDQ